MAHFISESTVHEYQYSIEHFPETSSLMSSCTGTNYDFSIWSRSSHSSLSLKELQTSFPDVVNHFPAYNSSPANNDSRRRSRYGVIGYAQGCEVFRQGKVLGEHTEVYDTEMAGLRAAAEETRRYILDEWTETKPERIIFYADNSAAITKIFEGTHGKVQQHSKAFRRAIGTILRTNTKTKIAISWCPGHSSIIGNEEADKLAKSALLLNLMNPNYRTQAFVGALHKRELLEEIGRASCRERV